MTTHPARPMHRHPVEVTVHIPDNTLHLAVRAAHTPKGTSLAGAFWRALLDDGWIVTWSFPEMTDFGWVSPVSLSQSFDWPRSSAVVQLDHCGDGGSSCVCGSGTVQARRRS